MGNFMLIVFILIQCKLLLITAEKFDLAEDYKVERASVFEAFLNASKIYKPYDLGKGFPDFMPPLKLRKALSNIMLDDDVLNLNQYTRDAGHPRLVTAIGKYYSKLLNRTLDPFNNVLITVGAIEALFLTFQTNTNPGDEWIIIEPYYELYSHLVKTAGGVARFITLKPKDLNSTLLSNEWTFDKEELASLFNEKTKGILVNTPHNPTGKVFTLEELEFIADLSRKWDTLVIFDEVYQFLTFNNKEHIRMATMPGMFDRTLSIGSGGKAFSATGWRIGWVYGGAKILNNLKAAQMYILLSVPTPLQEAFAAIFEDELENFGKSTSYLNTFVKTVESKKNYLIQALNEVGMTTINPDSGYFVIANWTTLPNIEHLNKETSGNRDIEFTKWMIKNMKILGLPFSSFYSKNDQQLGEGATRFCFVKSDQMLKKAVDALMDWKRRN